MIRRRLALCAALAALLAAPRARGAERTTKDETFALYLFNQQMGAMRAQELEIDWQGAKRQAVRVELDMAFNRMNEQAKIGMSHFERLSPGGRLEYFKTELRLSGQPQTTEGWVEGERCRIVERDPFTGKARESAIPWDREAVSEKQMEADFAKLLAREPGASMSHKVFVPDLRMTVPTTTTLIGKELRDTGAGKKSLFKIRSAMNIGSVVESDYWVDAAADIYEMEIALGPIKMRAVRQGGAASAPAAASGPAPEIFEPAILKTARRIARPEKTGRAVYRLRFKPGADRKIYEDENQRVLSAEGDVVRLEVAPQAPPQPFPMARVRPPAGGEKFLASSTFAQSDDPEIVRAAREAIGAESDAWGRAKRLESWVNRHIEEKSLGVAFASAKETLQTREGDCTEHAVLLTALCRAAGLPARAAEGLIYAPSIGGFGYHMWTEVYLDGWRDLDATRPGPRFDAAHIQLGASALDSRMTADTAAQLLKFFGKFEIEVETVE